MCRFLVIFLNYRGVIPLICVLMEGIGTYTIDENVIGHIARYTTVHDVLGFRFQWKASKPATSTVVCVPDECAVEFYITTPRGEIKFLHVIIWSGYNHNKRPYTWIYDRFDPQKIRDDAMQQLESLTCFDYALPVYSRVQILSMMREEITRMLIPANFAELCATGSLDFPVPVPIDRNMQTLCSAGSADSIMLEAIAAQNPTGTADSIMWRRSGCYRGEVEFDISTRDVFGLIDRGWISFENGAAVNDNVSADVRLGATPVRWDEDLCFGNVAQGRMVWEDDIFKFLNDAGIHQYGEHILATICSVVEHPRFTELFNGDAVLIDNVMTDILGSAYIPIVDDHPGGVNF